MLLDAANVDDDIFKTNLVETIEACVYAFVKAERTMNVNRPACLKLLLSAGAPIKQLKMTVRMWPIMNESDSVLLLYAAGFKDFENRKLNLNTFTNQGLEIPEIFKHIDKKYHAKVERKAGEIFCNNNTVPTLLEYCREVVRDELIKHNEGNLFKVTTALPLPKELQAYLIYGASLEVENTS